MGNTSQHNFQNQEHTTMSVGANLPVNRKQQIDMFHLYPFKFL